MVKKIKKNIFFEDKIYPLATIKDLRTDLIARARQMAINRNPNHPWKNTNDLELLKSVSLYDNGLNLACILLFGTDKIIKSALEYFKIDSLIEAYCVNRNDKDDIRTNLIESYDRLMNFAFKHLDDKFYLEEDIRVDVRSKIAKELVVNLLIYRDYSSSIPTKFIIIKDAIYTENANKPRNIGYIDLHNYSPYPKNPKIASVFKEIGLADELGSGINNIVKYNKIYSNGIPTFEDGEIFKVTVSL